MPETLFSDSGSLFSSVEFKDPGAGPFCLILYSRDSQLRTPVSVFWQEIDHKGPPAFSLLTLPPLRFRCLGLSSHVTEGNQ